MNTGSRSSAGRWGGLLFGLGYLKLRQLLFPLGGLVGAARRFVKLHQALKGFHQQPYFTNSRTKSILRLHRKPKGYGFDTGFVSFVRGWEPLRPDDCGSLWEHLVLEHLQAHWPDTRVQYWRDKAGNEVDFVLPHGREAVDVIECKWNPSAFDGMALAVFRSYYAKGRNYLVTPLEGPAYPKRFGKLEITVCGPGEIEG